MNTLTLNSYEVDEIVDTLLELRKLLTDLGGYAEEHELIQRALNALRYTDDTEGNEDEE